MGGSSAYETAHRQEGERSSCKKKRDRARKRKKGCDNGNIKSLVKGSEEARRGGGAANRESETRPPLSGQTLRGSDMLAAF